MARARRAARHEEVERDHFRAPHRTHRTHQFEVLEHDAPVVAACAPERRATYPQGARPIASKEAVEERAGCVVAGVPGQGIEVILWPNDMVAAKEGDNAGEGVGRITDVVISDHDVLVARESQAGEDAPDLAHGGYEFGVYRDVQDGSPPKRGGVRLEDLGRRPVHHDHLSHTGRQYAEVGPEFLRILRLHPAPNGHNVTGLDHPPPPGTRPTATT